VQRKVDLVYGGGSIGLMGKIAGTVHTGGGKVIGYVCTIRFVPSPLCISAAKRNTRCAISCTMKKKKKKKSIAEVGFHEFSETHKMILCLPPHLSLKHTRTNK